MAGQGDGGPAFARAGGPEASDTPQVGMSLRDWLAGRAITGTLPSNDEEAANAAYSALKMADMLIYALQEPPNAE